MRIGWLLWDSITPGVENASSRIRGKWVQKYMPNSIIAESIDPLYQMDAVIFQKRFTEDDIIWAKILAGEGKIIIFDCTDPEWNPEYMHYREEKQKRLKQIIEISHVVTVPTLNLLYDFEKFFPDKNVTVIKDRVDLELYPKVKVHKEHDPPYTIFWHGAHSNTDCIELARNDLEKIGKQMPIKLVCCYGPTMDNRISGFQNLRALEQHPWTEERCTELMLEADVSINPRFSDVRTYKSDNKTIKAYACGIPCVEKDFYKEIPSLLKSVTKRNEIGTAGRKLVETAYDSKQSVGEYFELVEDIRGIPARKGSPKNEIAIVSCITANIDMVWEKQNMDGADLILFTDNPYLRSDNWTIRLMRPVMVDPRMQSRLVKWLIHKWMPEYKYTLWIDGNIQVKTPLPDLIDTYLAEHDMCLFWHKDRDCVYEEAKDCINKKLDDLGIMQRQVDQYKADGFPAHAGLTESPVILRRHTPEIERFNEAVMAEMLKHSRRDQLCIDYLLYKLKLEVARFPGVLQRQDVEPDTSEHFKKLKHISKNRRL